MANQSKQIIPDSQSVARCLDPEALEILGQHSTFTIEELLEKINDSSPDSLQASMFIHQIKFVSNYGPPDFYGDISRTMKLLGKSISEEGSNRIFKKIRNSDEYLSSDFFNDIGLITFSKSIINIFTNGTEISLLSPDGKGWKKGILKMRFEFIPEEDEPSVSQEISVKNSPSSLDEIRQLANSSLAEQN